MAGEIFLENIGTRTCGLAGYARVVLRNQSGRALPVKVVDASSRLLFPAVPHPRPVTLAPRQQQGTGFSLQWFNWCGAPQEQLSPRVLLPGGGSLRVEPTNAVMNFSGRARCDDRRRASWIDVSPIAVTLGGAIASPAVPLGTPLCAAAQLTVQGGRQGAPFGTAVGSIGLTNIGTGSCVLSGAPTVVLTSNGGRPLSLSAVAPASPRTSPLVVDPGETGHLEVAWSNWCGQRPGPLDVEVTVAGAKAPVSGPFNGPPAYDFVPRCQNSSQPSTLTLMGAFMS